MASSAGARPNLEDSELGNMLAGLSEESKALVGVIEVIITKQIKTELELIKEEIKKKDLIITNLKGEVKDLQEKLHSVETHMDSIDQYERNDTVIVSGPSLPEESAQENAKSLLVSTIKEKLKINIKEEDLSVAHRLGPAHQNKRRPIIAKLVSRSLKYDLVWACTNLKPDLYVNESLTPKRYQLLRRVLAVRRAHRQKFQQCYTKDGKIMIKLKNSTVRYTIVDEQSLLAFLDNYPAMLETYQEIANTI